MPNNNIAVRDAAATIASGGTVSTAVYLERDLPAALQMPAAFTGTTVTFQTSHDNETFQQLYVAGIAYSETVAAGKNVSLDPGAFLGAAYIRVVSGSAEGAARVITVILWRP